MDEVPRPAVAREDGVVAIDMRRRVSIVVEESGVGSVAGNSLGSCTLDDNPSSSSLPQASAPRIISVTASAGRGVRTVSMAAIDEEDGSLTVLNEEPEPPSPSLLSWSALPPLQASGIGERPLAKLAERDSPPPGLSADLMSPSQLWQQTLHRVCRCVPQLRPCFALPAPPAAGVTDLAQLRVRTPARKVVKLPSITPRIADFYDSQGHTVYRIVTVANTADGTYHVPAFHRYSDFVRLHDELRSADGMRSKLPRKFPVPKRILHPMSVKQHRQQALQVYLATCSVHVVRATVPSAALMALCRFLDLEGALISRARTLYYSVASGGGSPGPDISAAHDEYDGVVPRMLESRVSVSQRDGVL
mmetsp:Transcript_9894/g.25513  ORF Transcript_9894/g.25513 Transcript_9894/m.25513 type:complete len:361 (-) Transcript_9894:14-1096(-)